MAPDGVDSTRVAQILQERPVTTAAPRSFVGIVIFIGVLPDTLLVRTIRLPAVIRLLGEKFRWPGTVKPVKPLKPAAPELQPWHPVVFPDVT